MNGICIELFTKEISIDEYISTCVNIPKFLDCCKHCENYNKKWSCPPFDFSADELWRSYRSLLLYGKKIVLNAELRERIFTPEELKVQYMTIISPIKEAMLDELFAMEIENPGSTALSAGSCDGCALCARADGKSCRNPQYIRNSIESIGGDVGKSIELYFKEKLVWTDGGRLPEHFFLLGGLLMR